MLRTLTTAALATTLAMPVMAQQQSQSQQTKPQNQTQQQQQQQQPEQMSQEARACLDQLEQIDQQLAELGFGRVGPTGYGAGYGVRGDPFGRAAPPSTATQNTRGPGQITAMSTPRADMHTLMRAGYVMAMNGYGSGCQQVAQAAEDIGNRYEEAVRTGDLDPDEMRRWRGEFLSSAVKVTELNQPMRAEEIIGADLRTMRDEDLGDINDVVFGPNGEPQYVIVSTGGFLGLGENQVPVRWQDLRVTAAPYRDTFVLDVSEQAFEDAPRIEGVDPAQLVSGDRGQEVDRYWNEAGVGKSG